MSYMYMYNDHFLTRTTTISEKNFFMTPFFYSVRTFACIRQHYFSKYWGDGCMGRPPSQICFGGTVPRVPLCLRPCMNQIILCCKQINEVRMVQMRSCLINVANALSFFALYDERLTCRTF